MAQKIGQARKAKLSIPKVGQKQAVGGVGKIGKGHPAAPSAPSVATSTAQPSNTAAPAQSQPSDPFQAAAPQGRVGFGKFVVNSAWEGAPGTDPRDASYWDAVSKLAFTDSQEYAKLERDQTRANTDYEAAVAQALRGRLGQQRELGEGAIRGNLGASGWLNRNEAEQTEDYTQKSAYAARAKELEDQDRAASESGLLGQFGIDSGSILHEALARWTEARQNEAAENEPEQSIPSAPGEAARPNTTKGSALASPNHPIQAKAFGDLMDKNKKKKGK